MAMTNTEKVKRWRKRLKVRVRRAMGGCCQICGYDRCSDALECHHVNPDKKEHAIGNIMAHPIALKRILTEIKKCILICSNCHREIHAGITEVPEPPLINEELFWNSKVD